MEPCPCPALSALDGAAVRLDEVAHDGQAEAEAAVRRVCARSSWLKRRRRAAGTRARSRRRCRSRGFARGRPPTSTRHVTRPPSGVNLMALVEQIRDDLLQPRRIARDRRQRRVEVELELELLLLGGRARPRRPRPGRRTPGRRPAAPSSACRSTMREMSSRSSMSCACALVARSMASPAFRTLRLVDAARAQELRRQEQASRAACAARGRASPGTGPSCGSPPRRSPSRRSRLVEQLRSLRLAALALGDVLDGQQDQALPARRRDRAPRQRQDAPSEARELALELELLEALVPLDARLERSPELGDVPGAVHELVDALGPRRCARASRSARGRPRWRTRSRALVEHDERHLHGFDGRSWRSRAPTPRRRARA